MLVSKIDVKEYRGHPKYSTSKTESFETTKITQAGVRAVLKVSYQQASVSLKAGISRTTTQVTGKETVETKTDTIEAQIEISEKSKIAVTITGKRFTAKVPWTGIQTKYYTDGTITTEKVTGVYTGVSINEIAVQYGRETSLTQEEELYGPEVIPRGTEVIPEEKKGKTVYSEKTEIVYRMVAAKETLFTLTDNGKSSGETVRVWKPVNHQHGTCIIGASISPGKWNDHIFKTKVAFVFYGVAKDAIMNPSSWVMKKELASHKLWKLRAAEGYVCPGIAVTRSNQEPKAREYCCFRKKYLTQPEQLQPHKSEQLIGIHKQTFRMAQASDDQNSIVPTGGVPTFIFSLPLDIKFHKISKSEMAFDLPKKPSK